MHLREFLRLQLVQATAIDATSEHERFQGDVVEDAIFRATMITAVGEFHPVVECYSMLQVRELIVQGVCAGLLPSFGTHGLSGQDVVTCEFAPMKDYGRSLVLHWNNRQMRRRGIEESVIKRVAKALQR